MKKYRTCIIGAGRVGTTIAAKITQKESCSFVLDSVSSRSEDSLNRARKLLGNIKREIGFYLDNKKAAKGADVVLICTPDDIISKVSKELFEEGGGVFKDPSSLTVIHFSGLKPLNALIGAQEIGVHRASTHPIKSFASIDSALETLAGTIFGITYSDNISEKVAKSLIEALEGRVIEVQDSKKSLYHASACIASNFLVTLIDFAVDVLSLTGASNQEALLALSGLIDGTVSNIKELGTKQALTGPIARGDIQTIRQHLIDLEKFSSEDYLKTYKALGLETAKIARYNKWITREVFDELIKYLK